MNSESPRTRKTGSGTHGKKIRRLALASTAACVLTAGLSGCLLNRVVEVREQFCDFDQNFRIQFAESPQILMNYPVLLDRDILWLAGTVPTQRIDNPGELIMTYIIEEAIADPDPDKDISVELHFELLDEAFKLSQVRMDPKFSVFMNSEYMDEETLMASAQNICNTGWRFGSTGVEFDISQQDLDKLPGQAEVLELMGPPHNSPAREEGWTYRYRLKGDPNESRTARFTVWFDEVSQKPLRMESRYARYQTRADFVTKKMSMNVKM